ncbi:MAG: MetQ/NlpA family ABC transporter substrate-binding protein [Oscillospiraceae bacterium]|nr:MetQ/NlpA family ABC transporter substrate-binding protein [Oscillospiraceae bacterium]
MKKFLSALLAATLTLSLAACGSTASSAASSEPASSEAVSSEAASSEAASSEAAADFTGDGYDATVDYAALAGTTITVAASPVPHAEILNVAKDILAKADITLEIKEFTDYVQPNLVTENGEVDANYFQHGPYLENFNAENGTHLVSVAAIHYEPFGLYPGKTKTLEELPEGAKIAVPNDTTNEARALQLLSAQGIITVKEGAGLTATKNDIIENPHNVEIVEMEAAQLPRTLADVDYAVINGNYAQEAGFSVGKDAIAVEDASSEAAQTYANILVVKEGNEENPAIKALAAALTSQAVKDYINATYDGAVVAIF